MKVHKDKAQELVSSMLNAGKGITSEFVAGECAKIMVQEFINEFKAIVQLYGEDFDNYLHYWEIVMKELKKLCHDKS